MKDAYRNVIVVPCVQNDTGSARTPSHHEARKVRDTYLCMYVHDGIYDEAEQRKQEPEGDEGESPPREVGSER